MPVGTATRTYSTRRFRSICMHYNIWSAEMVPDQIMGEMVLDGGGQFIPAGVVGLHTLSLLLASLVPRDRAKEDTHTHTGKKRK